MRAGSLTTPLAADWLDQSLQALPAPARSSGESPGRPGLAPEPRAGPSEETEADTPRKRARTQERLLQEDAVPSGAIFPAPLLHRAHPAAVEPERAVPARFLPRPACLQAL